MTTYVQQINIRLPEGALVRVKWRSNLTDPFKKQVSVEIQQFNGKGWQFLEPDQFTADIIQDIERGSYTPPKRGNRED
jgi:hypothetical protein